LTVPGEPPALQSQLHAELANRAKDEFLANISHEIRTPLTAILGFTDLLLRGGEDEARRREYLTLIRRSGKHLLDLINDILDLSKIKAGKMRIRPTECSVHEVICDVVALSRLAADQRQLSLKYEWHGPIPQHVHTDPARFRQLVTNLLGNALKFTERGGVTVSLEMLNLSSDKAQPVRPMLAVRVTDTGIGISRDKLVEIFEPFNQADTTVTRRYGGTGLGLTITREIVRSLGGKLTVASQPGVGSTFTATIDPGPLDQVPMVREMPALDGVPAGSEAPHASNSLAGELAGVRVLLVEDGDVNRRLIAAMLTEAGARVDTAENGRAGIERALAGRFDTILMDMQMPVLDGYEAARQLRANGITAPIIALTANAMAGDRDKCLEAGCNDYVSKPIDRASLLTAVSRHVGKPSETLAPS
jgi:CheY-like chemotaxis protein